MSLGGKGEFKGEENEFFGKLGRQNQGKTHESKRIAKGKKERQNAEKRNKRRRGRALGARGWASSLSFHPTGTPRKQRLGFR